MKNWEQENRLKQFNSKIKNVRPTLRQTEIPRSHNSALQPLQSLQETLVYKLLKIHGLQQYARQMRSRGYESDLGRLMSLTNEGLSELMNEIKVYPGHQIKMKNMLVQLKKNNGQLRLDQESRSFKKSTFSKADFSQEVKLPFIPSIKNTKKGNQVFSALRSTGKRQMFSKQLGQYQDDNQFLINELNQKVGYDTADSKRKQIKSIATIIKNNHKLPLPSSGKKQLRANQSYEQTVCRSSKKFPSKQRRQVPKTMTSKAPSRSNTQQPKKIGSFSIVRKKRLLMDIDSSKQNYNFELAKTSVRSIDGSRMTSTIINIDIQELCACTAFMVISWISPSNKFFPSKRIVDEQFNCQLKLSNHQPSENRTEQQLRTEQSDSQNFMPIQASHLRNSHTSNFTSSNSQVDFGFADPVQVFYEQEISEVDQYVPPPQILANYIKNIMNSAKMQRQIPIMALCYIKRFLQNCDKLVLNTYNYKRIVMIALLLASKIWDDQSFQTPSFAQAFPSFSTVLLNQMQKVFLGYLSYDLTIQKKPYVQMYMSMRANRNASMRSYQVRSLRVERILQLQRGKEMICKGSERRRDKSN